MLRLILFDIDGTLVSTGGAGMRAMNKAFERVAGVERALEGIPLAGRTDRVIVRDALTRIDPAVPLDDGWIEQFRDVYCEMLEVEIADGASAGKRVLPGVGPLLDALSCRPDVVLGLLTGNFQRSARIKLQHFDLWRYFGWGAFGDAHVDRNDLLPVALEAARRHAGMSVEPDDVFVVGDTAHDVTCARSGGAHALAVATGIVSVDDLRLTGADAVLADLSETDVVLRTLVGS